MEISDFLSNSHALEHFGLGRHGDSIDTLGHIKVFNKLIKMLKPNEYPYINAPIAKETSIQFHSHRIFNPTDMSGRSSDRSILQLHSFDYIDDAEDLS